MLRLSAALALGSVATACTGSHTQPSSGSGSATSTGSGSVAPGSSVPGSSVPGSSVAGSPSTSTPAAPGFDTLAPRISGGLLRRGDPGYDARALLYNPRFSGQPGPKAIARCRTRDDVAACVRFAADGGAPLRLRNGGHSYGGWSSGPGLVADLSRLNRVHVDRHAMTATVGAGALLADVYAALDASGVSIGAGSCPTVGVTGLTLGGGVGVLARSYGLTCDQLRALDVVTADGRARTVDAHHDPDLFWALRGGGGGLAAVTALTFSVRPAPRVTRFFLQWPGSAAVSVLGAWQQWIAGCPRELWSTCKVLIDPGAGGLRVTVSGTWTGSGSPGATLRSLLAATPSPSSNSTSRASYGQTMLGEAGCSGQDAGTCIVEALSPGRRLPFAATSSIVQEPLPTKALQAIVHAVTRGGRRGRVSGVVESGVSFDSLGGAIGDIDGAATAFPWRSALALVQHTATWSYADAATDPAPFDALVGAQRKSLTPWCGASAYVNYADPAIKDFPTAYWGANAARLQTVKRTYDPHNVFSFPQSVPL